MILFDIPADGAFFALVAAIAVAGIVRGFSGFGTGMIVGPVASAAYSPQVAIVVILVIDTLPAIPLVVGALRKVSYRELVPVLFGYAALLPVGIWLLKTGDTVALRWFMSAVIAVSVALLWSGWCYTGPRNAVLRIGIGGVSGFLAGSVSVAGPPLILYWMALRTGAGMVRANMIMFFAITTVFTATGLFLSGVMTRQSVTIGALGAPVYLVMLLAGARLFGIASEATYKRIALAIVLVAAVISLPALDSLRP